MYIKIVNIEQGMPSVLIAKNRLTHQLFTSKRCGEKVIKVIHGYGSSGKGGAIKRAVISVLNEQLTKGSIKGFVNGENFSPFSEETRKLLSLYPDITRDHDYSRGNDGITIIWF